MEKALFFFAHISSIPTKLASITSCHPHSKIARDLQRSSSPAPHETPNSSKCGEKQCCAVEIRRPSGLPKEFLAGESLRCTCCHDPLPGTSSRTRKDTFRDSFKHLCWGRSARISILANGRVTVCARASLNLRPHSADASYRFPFYGCTTRRP